MIDAQRLGREIRRQRQKNGVTQAQLAERLFVTAQTVSKWETGRAMPDLDNLCGISSLFGVSVDRLLGGAAEQRTFIAIDGGGTKTEFLLFDRTGMILRRVMAGPCNPNSVSVDGAVDVLRQGIENLLTVQAEPSGIFAGIAGAGTGNNAAVLSSRLTAYFPHIPVTVGSDILNVIHGVRDTERCVAAICGTGSAVFAWDGEDLHRFGGWGYRLDDGGSGYDIGRAALRHTLQAENGLTGADALSAAVEERLGGRVIDKLDTVYAKGTDFVASFAAVVLPMASAGEKAAVAIVERSAGELAKLILAARNKGGTTVIFGGGLAFEDSALMKALRSLLPEGFTLISSALPPIYGACLYALRLYDKGTEPVDPVAFDEKFRVDRARWKGDN